MNNKIAIQVTLLSGITKGSNKNADKELIDFLDKAEIECAKSLSNYLDMFGGLPFSKQLFISLKNKISGSQYKCNLFYTGIEGQNGAFIAHFEEL